MLRILLLCFVISAAYSELLSLTPCKPGDWVCSLGHGQTIFPKVISGDLTSDCENLDPMKLKEIVGNLTSLYYKLTDVTFTGLKDCYINNVKLNSSKSSLYCDMTCPHSETSGNYLINGQILSTPIEGEGTCTVTAKEYRIGIDCVLIKVTGDDGKEHYKIKDFELDLDPWGGVSFDFKNLFNGNKELSDKAHKIANDNWREIALLSQGPVMKAVVGKIIENCNKYIELIPIEQYLILN